MRALAIAIAAVLLLAGCGTPRPGEPVVYRVRVSADQAFRRRADWRALVSERVRGASEAFQKEFGIRWQLDDVNEWAANPQAPRPDALRSSLFEGYRTATDLLVGITGLPQSDDTLGSAYPYSRVIIVCDFPARTEAGNTAVLAHQLATALGAWESPQKDSVMSPRPASLRFDANAAAVIRAGLGVDFRTGIEGMDPKRRKRIADAFAKAKAPPGSDPIARALSGRGLDYINAGSPERGAAMLQEAAALDPANAEIQFRLGSALLFAGRNSAAIAAFRKALEHDPRHAMAHKNLGIALAQASRFQEALPELKAAAGMLPADAGLRMSLGNVLLGLGQRDAGLAELRESLRLRPDSALARASLDRALQRGKN